MGAAVRAAAGFVVVIGLLAAAAAVSLARPHWVPVLLWRVPYTTYEVGGEDIDPDALACLQRVRQATGRRYRITSGYRPPEKNAQVGGASGSQHLSGRAFDVWVPQAQRAHFYTAAREAGFTGFGWGNRTVHVDMGRTRWWTYDDDGRAMAGAEASRYLHKAPDNFLADFGLSR